MCVYNVHMHACVACMCVQNTYFQTCISHGLVHSLNIAGGTATACQWQHFGRHMFSDRADGNTHVQ